MYEFNELKDAVLVQGNMIRSTSELANSTLDQEINVEGTLNAHNTVVMARALTALAEADVSHEETLTLQPVTDGSFDQAAYTAALDQGKGPVTARRAGIIAGSVATMPVPLEGDA